MGQFGTDLLDYLLFVKDILRVHAALDLYGEVNSVADAIYQFLVSVRLYFKSGGEVRAVDSGVDASYFSPRVTLN